MSVAIKPAATRRTYPIGFNLYDENDENVLYIESGSTGGRTLHLTVENESGETVRLEDTSDDTASPTNYHFELKFRPKTLADASKILLGTSDVGDWSLAQEKHGDGTVSLYLVKKTSCEIQAGEKLDVTLEHVRADAAGGARGTRVEFKYKNLTYKSDSDPLAGTRTEHLSIINRRGKKNIPLYVGFVGSNTVLNDGSEANELELRIGNTSSAPISLATGSAKSKFILSLDSGHAAAKPWALGEDSQVEGINVKASFDKGNNWSDVSKSTQGMSSQWEIEAASLSQLDGTNYIQVKLSDIVTGHPSGFTNLYVRYENIPDYWDGEKEVAIEKTPLRTRQDADKSAKVKVKGNEKLEGKLQATKIEGIGALVKGMIIMWHPQEEPPAGWYRCDGKTYGGYKVPNLNEKFVRGVTGNSRGTGGNETIYLTESQIPNHASIHKTESGGKRHAHKMHGITVEVKKTHSSKKGLLNIETLTGWEAKEVANVSSDNKEDIKLCSLNISNNYGEGEQIYFGHQGTDYAERVEVQYENPQHTHTITDNNTSRSSTGIDITPEYVEMEYIIYLGQEGLSSS